MPSTDHCQGSSNFSRSILSLRRDHTATMARPGPGSGSDLGDQELELETFQKHVAEKFAELASSVGSDELLSLSWLLNLLEIFISCQEEFHLLLMNNKCNLSKSPIDRLIADFHERSVKALDVCNAIRDGIEQIRQWEKLLDIVICSLDRNNHKNLGLGLGIGLGLGEGQIRRAKKGLAELLIEMLDKKDSNTALSSHRNRSFGSRNKDHKNSNNLGHFRSLSWSVSRSWSASKQLQAIGYTLNPPKSNETIAMAIYTMSFVLMFVMWVLVAAFPCQDRGLQLQTHFSIPKQFVWAVSISSLHDRIVEESKKRERKNACGLLKEIYLTEKWSRQMNELLDSLQFPLDVEKETEVREKVEEIRVVFESFKEGLQPLETQVRKVFHRIVRTRTEGQN